MRLLVGEERASPSGSGTNQMEKEITRRRRGNSDEREELSFRKGIKENVKDPKKGKEQV